MFFHFVVLRFGPTEMLLRSKNGFVSIKWLILIKLFILYCSFFTHYDYYKKYLKFCCYHYNVTLCNHTLGFCRNCCFEKWMLDKTEIWCKPKALDSTLLLSFCWNHMIVKKTLLYYNSTTNKSKLHTDFWNRF